MIAPSYGYQGSSGNLTYEFEPFDSSYFGGLFYCAEEGDNLPDVTGLECHASVPAYAQLIDELTDNTLLPTESEGLGNLLSAIATSPSSFTTPVEFLTPFSGQILAEREDTGTGFVIEPSVYVPASGTLRVTLIPIPAPLALLGIGLAGFWCQRHKKFRTAPPEREFSRRRGED